MKDNILGGKPGGCQRFAFDISEGQHIKISLTSSDSTARLILENSPDDEMKITGWSQLASIDRVLNSASIN